MDGGVNSSSQMFREALRAQVSASNWEAWLSSLDAAADGGRVTVTAPSEFHLRWVKDKHASSVEEAVRMAYGPEALLAFTVDDRRPAIGLETGPPPGGDAPVPHDANGANGNGNGHGPARRLVDKYRFDGFVVGQSNRFAHAAAMAVAEQPGTHYNPLFIYGGAGLGKTHLLNAIGHLALELYPGLSVRYVTSEAFFNDFIDSIRRKRMDDFKHRYRTTDILLLDDVQFFEGKEQILEEFFHTFNSLYESGKQMVISSDRHPRNLSSLEDRLRSRFEWGLLTDIQPPDIETRIAILKRHSESAGMSVPPPVLQYIAGLVSDNVRELEGALTRVTAFAALTHQTVDLETAERVLQDLIPGNDTRPVSPQDIIEATARAYGFAVEEVTGESRRQPLVLCRQVAMYLCRELTDLSLPKIGALFGGRDHTTVMYALDKVKRVMRSDREVFDTVSDLSQSLRRT